MSRAGVRNCLLAAALFGASTPAASRLAGHVTPLVLAGLLYLGAAIAVLPFWIARRPSLASLQRDGHLLATAVLAGGAVGPALLTAGLAHTSAASASLLLNMELTATVVVASTVFREHLGSRMLAAAGLVTAASVLLVWEPGAALDVGGLLVVAACTCWGLDNSVTARIDHIAPQHVTFLKGVVAGTVNVAIGLAVSDTGTSIHAGTILASLVVGAFGYGASITLWVRGAQQLGAARGQVVFASAPFLGAAISWVALSEPIDLSQAGAMALAAVGVAISLRSDHDHPHTHEPLDHDHEHTHDEHHQHEHHEPVWAGTRHRHPHRHEPISHSHSHVPDLHHRHEHTEP